MQTEAQLPGYVERAITSRLARTVPYSLLSEQQWRDIASHVLDDETIVIEATGRPFLPRGTQNCFGHGRRRTLNGILSSAVSEHANLSDGVPHYSDAERVYKVVTLAEELEELGIEMRLVEVRE